MGATGNTFRARRLLAPALLYAVFAAPAAAEISPDEAAGIVRKSGIQGGLIVHAGCRDGRFTAALQVGENYLVQGIDADEANVAAARRHFREEGVAGPVSAIRWTDAARLPYAENMVNLLVVEDRGELDQGEMLRVLAPGGGAVVLAASAEGRGLAAEEILFKPWPAGMDEWSHWDHGADGNAVSADVFVGPPRRMQWVDGPAWSKKHWGPRTSAMVTAGGRFFYVQDETPTSLFNIDARWVLTARDAFNGIVLWRRELPGWTTGGWGPVVQRDGNPAAPPGLELGVWGELSGGSGVRDAMDVMVADKSRLFVPLAIGEPLSALEAATGEVIRTYEGTAPVEEVVLADGVLVVAGKGKVQSFDPSSGERLWEAAGGNVCAIDGRAFLTTAGGRSVLCVDLGTGKEAWACDFAAANRATGGDAASEKAGFNSPLLAGAGVVLAASRQGKTGQTIAISAADGGPLWQSGSGDTPFGRGGGPFFIDGLVWTLDAGKGMLFGLDPRTGELKREVPAPAIRYVGHHPRCYLAKATSRYVIAKERGADFVDLATGEVTWSNWLRGSCHRGVLPANGLLYAGQHSCRCYTEAALHGFHALAPAGEEGSGFRVQGSGFGVQGSGFGVQGSGFEPRRLEHGPAFPSSDSQLSTLSPQLSSAWPTFRHDAARSGATAAEFPQSLDPRWSVLLGGKVTAPAVAAGRVYVAASDRHTLYALDEDSGEAAWCYTAGGRIDSPPTIHEGLALFGCRDGWVYCLRAADGELVWRFRAAPEERMVGAYGQLESAWPVPGSVLVAGGVAYCVAGRSSYLDGGLYVHALEPQSGRLVHTRRLEGPWPGAEIGAAPETPNRGFTSDGALPDVLVADAESVYLRHLRFDPSLGAMEDMKPNVYVSPALEGENRGGDHKYWDNLIEVSRHALFTDPAVFHRSFFQNFPGLRLYATTGLLDDDSWHRRMYWSYGQVVGQYIVFRGTMGYAVQVFATSPREGGFNAGDGYVVHAGRTAEREEGGKLFALRPDESKWRVRVPLRPLAMVLAADKLVLAGPPDLADPGEALAAVEGREGGLVWVLDAEDGRKLAEYRLDSPPRYDGLAVTEGRCYMATSDGKIACFAAATAQ